MRFWENTNALSGKCSTESALEEAKISNGSREKRKILKIWGHSDENMINNLFFEVVNKGIQTDDVESEMQDTYSSHFFLTRKANDNYETIQRRKIPIRAPDDEVEVYSTEENVVMNPVDYIESIFK